MTQNHDDTDAMLNEMMARGRDAQNIAMQAQDEHSKDVLLTTDATVWAAQFNETAEKLGCSCMDEGWLTGWFANAMGVAELRLRSSTIFGAELNAEAEARGAAEQRRKDAEGNEVPSAWVRPNDFYNDEGNDRFGPWSSEQIGEYTIPLYTHPTNVAALEAKVKELEAENDHQRTQVLEFRNDDRRIRLAAERVCSVREGSEIFEARIALRAALKREGGV